MNRSDDTRLAFFWMCLSALGFSTMMLFVKMLAGRVPHFELVFFRSVVNCAVALGFMVVLGESFNPKRKNLLIFRGVVGFCGVTCFFYGITHLPISIAALLNWSSPIFVILFSRIFLKERVQGKTGVWIALAFTGLILLMRPDLDQAKVVLSLSGVAIGILGAAFGGLAYVAVRAATAQVGVNTIIFYFTATSALLSLPLTISKFHIPDASAFIQLLMVGLCASVGQFAMTHAYRYAEAGIVSALSLMNAAISAFFGWVIFDEILVPMQWLGMAFLAIGVSQIALLKRRLKI